MDVTITAKSADTISDAIVFVVVVTIITGFPILQPPVAAKTHLACVITTIVLHVVAIVAGFLADMDNAITATRCHAVV